MPVIPVSDQVPDLPMPAPSFKPQVVLDINQAESIFSYDDTYDDDGESNAYDVFRTSFGNGSQRPPVRLTDEVWSQLSSDDRRAWTGMSN